MDITRECEYSKLKRFNEVAKERAPFSILRGESGYFAEESTEEFANEKKAKTQSESG